MRIPDLPPDIRIRRMHAADEAVAFAIKKAALGPYIAAQWGWDDAIQFAFHRQHFGARPVHAIIRDGETLGTVCLHEAAGRLSLDEFYLVPQWQRQGLGARILRHCLALADSQALPVRLQHLQWNPVGSLYLRHGFVETGRDEFHVFMQRSPGAGA